MITPIEESLLKAMILVIMFGLGCSLSLKDFKESLKTPKPLVVGFLSQYLVMPALAFAMARFFRMEDAVAIGLIIVACCPSGTTSSLFNYFAKGDLALSISLSSVTTGAALVAMPLLLALYSAPFATGSILIDTKSIVLSLLVCLVPVAGGVYLRHRSERWAKNLEETGAALGIIVILFLIASWLPRNTQRLLQTDAPILLTSVCLGLGGFLFGYYLSRALGMSRRRCRTVALETGIQNGPLAIAIILMSFPDKSQANAILWPVLLYSFFIVNTSTLVTYLMRVATRHEWFQHENQTIQQQLFTQGSLKP